MYSQEAQKHADACRFCWMCRHLCPVGLRTGREVNTARAKGLLVSMEKRGFPMDAGSAEAMFECTLCTACENDCVTGYRPTLFIREARSEALANGFAPAYVEAAIDALEAEGNPLGLPRADKFALLKEEIAGLPETADVLLVLGWAAAYKEPMMVKALMRVLRKAGVGFTVLKDEPDTGLEMGDLCGYVEEARERAQAFAKRANATGAQTLVMLDPYEASFLKHQFPEWGIELFGKVETATSFVAALLSEGRIAPTRLTEGVVTYHDSARLARELDEHEPARQIIAATGRTVKEMFLNKRLAKCCGSALFKAYAPKLAAETAKGRIDDALRTGADTLVVACPESRYVLESEMPDGMALTDVFTLLDAAL